MPRIIIVDAFPVDAEGQPLAGFVQIGTTSTGKLILDAVAPTPQGATLISEGSDRFSRTALGTHADRVLEATWERTEGGVRELVREKNNVVISRNPTVTILERDIPPHRWLGE